MHQRSTTDKEPNNITMFVPSLYYSTFDRYNNFRNLILNHSLHAILAFTSSLRWSFYFHFRGRYGRKVHCKKIYIYNGIWSISMYLCSHKVY